MPTVKNQQLCLKWCEVVDELQDLVRLKLLKSQVELIQSK